MTSPADVLEKERTFTFDDPKTRRRVALKVGVRPFDVELSYECWLQEQALRAVTRQRHWLTPADYVTLMDGWRRDCAAGVYEFTGLAAWQAQRSRAGALELLFLDLAFFNAEATRPLVERILADQAKAEEVKALVEAANAPFPPPGAAPEEPAA